jgi:hypothetical protein
MILRGPNHGENGVETIDMGTIIEFPADAASRRLGSTMAARSEGPGQVVILPVVRIERHAETVDGRGPEEGATPGRRRRRRARS